MNEKNDKLISFAIYVCANSKDDPNEVSIVVEYEYDRIKITTTNKKTKEQKFSYEA